MATTTTLQVFGKKIHGKIFIFVAGKKMADEDKSL